MSAEKKETNFSIKSLQSLLIEKLSSKIQTNASDIDPKERFNYYGLKNEEVTEMAFELFKDLGIDITIEIIWNHPTIEKLSEYILMELEKIKSSKISVDNFQNTTNNDKLLNEPIAIIGIACRFPKANNPDEYWKMLINEVDAIQEVPKDRWNIDDFYHPDLSNPGTINTRKGGFLDQVDKFDAAFFGISPREANHMDPQQRLMLELSWEALEDAKLPVLDLKDSDTGVFTGVIYGDYGILLNTQTTDNASQHSATGTHYSIIANRISYVFGLQGPSITCDTACSGSLVAIHLACQSLRSGESSLAIAGGVNLIVSPNSSVLMSKFGGLSPDGYCKSFDARANGYARGEGAGVVILKPISKAISDGNQIYAVIKGSAVNNDGASNGLTAPNPIAQERMLRDAYKRAGIDTKKVHYIEAHGTGTALGDPIEVKAIGEVLGKGRSTDNPLIIGSVKSNFGHLESAAGMAGLIKVILSLKNLKIPRSLHFITPNPNIPFEDMNIKVQSNSAIEWPETDDLLTAGVNSFGFGGTNAHIVIQEYTKRNQEIFCLSGDDKKSLNALSHSMKELINNNPSADLQSICSTSALNFTSKPERIAILVKSKSQLIDELSNYQIGKHNASLVSGTVSDQEPKIAFVFSGYENQWLSIGMKLFQYNSIFRNKLLECDELIRKKQGWSLINELNQTANRFRFNYPSFLEPAIVSIGISIATLWQAWGIRPNAVVGNGLGEITAAHVAGALTLEDAIRIACCRGDVLNKIRGLGGMLLVSSSVEMITELISDFQNKISIAIENSNQSTVISGSISNLKEISSRLNKINITSKFIPISYAAHSDQIDFIKDELYEALRDIHPKQNDIKIVSSVYSEALTGYRFGASYWVRNLREPVLFSKSIQFLLEEGFNNFLEVGTDSILQESIKESVNHFGKNANIMSSFQRNKDEISCLLETVGTLYTNGFQINWSNLYPSCKKELEIPDNIKQEVKRFGVKEDEKPQFFLFSAKTKPALIQSLIAFKNLITENNYPISNLSSNTAINRNYLDFRIYLIASNKDQLVSKIEDAIQNINSGKFEIKRSGNQGELQPVFVYGGQGQQWIGMGKELIKKEKVFRKKIEEIDSLFSNFTHWSIIKELQAVVGGPDGDPKLNETEYAQPCIFAIQIGLTELWKSWGVFPSAVVGHSVGEVAAAHISGRLSLSDAVKVIFQRAKFMQKATGQGKMVSIKLTDTITLETINQHLQKYKENVSIGAYNSYDSIVISGDDKSIGEIVNSFQEQGIIYKSLPVDYAFHSPQMEPFKNDLVESLSGIEVVRPTLKLVSTVTGKLAEVEDYDAEYWGRNMVGAVHFYDAIEYLIEEEKFTNFIEISATPVIASYISKSLMHKKRKGIVVPSMQKETDTREVMLNSLGTFFREGYSIDYRKLYHEDFIENIKLPLYPWQRERFWPNFITEATKRRNGILSDHERKNTNEIKQTNNSAPIESEQNKIAETVSKVPDSPVTPAQTEAALPKNAPVEQVKASPSNLDDSIKEKVISLTTKVLGLDSTSGIELDKQFSDMGMDSIMSIEFRAKLEKEYSITLPDTIIVDYPTIQDLLDFLNKTYPEINKSVDTKVVNKTETTPKDTKKINIQPEQNKIAETVSKVPDSPVTPAQTEAALPKNAPVEQVKASPSNLDGSIKEKVISLTTKVLGLDSTSGIELDKQFSDMGMDSIMSIEFRAKLEKEYSITLPDTIVVDYPTIQDLLDFLNTMIRK